MICQCRSSSCNRCTNLEGDTSKGGSQACVRHVWGAGSTLGNFCTDPSIFFFSFKQDSTSFIYIFMTYIYGLIQLTKSNNNDKDGT